MTPEEVVRIAMWGIGIGLTVLGILYGYHEMRLQSLENTREVKADADRQRESLRREIHDFREETSTKLETLGRDSAGKRDEMRHDMANMRAEIGMRLETMRTETNDTLVRLSEQISGLATTAAASAAAAATVATAAVRRRK